ncbi:MAG: SIMPL domain-containing protein [Candidatus Kapaibacteriales bacterium]
MIKSISLLATLLIFGFGKTLAQNHNLHPPRTVSVSGTAELEVVPDRIYLSIGYGEYWKEEYEEGKEWNDFRTKVPLEMIEPKILAALKQAGFGSDKITVKQIGNNYRQQGKDFLLKKTIELKLDNLDKMNEIISMVDVRGIDKIVISRMESDKIEEMKLKVKAEAVRAAKEKASVMLDAVGEKAGKLLTLSEGNSSDYNPYSPVSNRYIAMEGSEMDLNPYQSELGNYKNIKLKATVSAVFEIE